MHKIHSNIRIALVAVSLTLPSVLFVHAANTIDNPLKGGTDSIPAFLALIVHQLVIVGGVVAAIFVFYSGFLFLKAAGNEKEIEDAKKTFFYTIIGVAVLLGAEVISTIIKNTVESVTKG